MKKLTSILSLLVLSCLFIACNNSVVIDHQKADQKNDLLPEKVIVYSEVNFKTQPMEEWTDGVDSNYMDALNMSVLNSDVEYYSSNVMYDTKTRLDMNKQDVLLNMEEENSEGISALYFVESWNFNKANYKFDKTVESWAPVFEYYRIKNGEAFKHKKLLYDVWSSDAASVSNEKLIAHDMTYEVNFVSEHETNEHLNLEKLVDLIVLPVVEGKKKAYDFYEHIEMPLHEVMAILGHSVDSVEEYDARDNSYTWHVIENDINLNNITAFIFIEDWYMDEKTFTLRKKVKAIAPVIQETLVDEDEEVFERKRIAFKVNLLEKLEKLVKPEEDHKKS